MSDATETSAPVEHQLSTDQLDVLRSAPLGPLPNKVRLARTLLGVQAGEIAKAIGITRPYYSAIESGNYKDIPIESVARPLSTVFHCQIEDLFPAREAVGS